MEEIFAVDTRHHGQGDILFRWHPQSSYIASTGTSRVVHVVTSRGKLVDQIVPPSASKCIELEWNADGTMLAVLQAGAGTVLLWDLATKRTHLFDSGARELAFLRWAGQTSTFVVAPVRGRPFLVDAFTLRQWPCGQRDKGRPLCGAWSRDGRFVYAAEDGVVSVCDAAGRELDAFKVQGKVSGLQLGSGGQRPSTLSGVVDGARLLVVDLDAKDKAAELSFEPKYGRVCAHHWFGDGSLAVAFVSGYFVVLASALGSTTQEQYCARFHEHDLVDVAFSPAQLQAVTCGDGVVKRVDLSAWGRHQVHVYEEPIEGARAGEWSPDGGVLAVATTEGCLRAFRLCAEAEPDAGAEQGMLHVGAAQPFTASGFFGAVAFVLLVAYVVACVLLDVPPGELLDAATGATPVV